MRSIASSDVPSLLNQAVTFHRAGFLAEAERLYRQVLEIRPENFDALHLLGVICLQRDEPAEAVRHIGAALKSNSDAPDAHNHLGNALLALGRPADALSRYDEAIARKPEFADALVGRGNALRQLGRFEEMLANCDRAITLRPGHCDAFNSRAVALQELGRLDEALASCDKAIALNPNQADAYYNRGNVLTALRRFEEACAAYDHAITLKPAFADAFNNRGGIRLELKLYDRALSDFERAIALKPDFATAHNNRGAALSGLRRLAEAVQSFDRATTIDPRYAGAFNNRGAALTQLQLFDPAMADFNRAIELNPDYGDAFYNRATTLLRLRRFEEAVADYDRAITYHAKERGILAERFHAKMHLCDWNGFDEDRARVWDAIETGTGIVHPFAILAARSSPADQKTCAERFVLEKYPPADGPLWRGERHSHDRMRVAYLSADFHDHATAHLTAGLFEHHDRSRFETIALSFGPDDGSDMRRRLTQSFDRFLDVRDLPDQSIAELVHRLEVDIAVDLKGLTYDARLGVLARRPAPVQVSYLGYPGTMGAAYIDYLIGDRFVIPDGLQEFYSEKIVYLPGSYQVNDAARRIADIGLSRAEANLPEADFVFCCFNNNYKITPDVFDVWMHLLQKVDGSVLWLLEGNATAPDHLRREAQRRGVGAERLIFAPRMAPESHLARHRLADLFLDTYYCNAHTTASDALWAGLPVLTCCGETFASRVAGSLLAAVGLPELITHSLDEYTAIALKLADEPALVVELKQKLARNRNTHPLFDTARTTRHIEAAYATIWERFRRGEPPEGFSVDAMR